MIAALAAFTISAPAMALNMLWLDSDHSPYSGYYNYGQALTFTDGTVTVEVTGWSINDSDTINDARLGVWTYGLGVLNSDGDNSHTIDNSGWTDFVVLLFDQAVILSSAQFNTGWHDMNDTDATIGYDIVALPFNVAGAIDGQNASVLSSWNLYSSDSSGFGDEFRNINPGSNSGNLWLIGASFDNPTECFQTSRGTKCKEKPDGFKLELVKYETAVPEPATWAMMLLGFGLIGGVMRRRNGRNLKSANTPRLAHQ
ncbi:MAG: PEPxxWA-CTERM sorting domain-containing protein [Novosphingobium sp.]